MGLNTENNIFFPVKTMVVTEKEKKNGITNLLSIIYKETVSPVCKFC